MKKAKNPPVWDFVREAEGKWRWRRISNGRSSISSSSWSTRTCCVKSARENGYRG